MNVDGPTDEFSLLLSASRVGRNEIVCSLIDANPDGIDVNAKNYREEFALLAAAENGHLGVARRLLQHGAKVNMAGPKVSRLKRMFGLNIVSTVQEDVLISCCCD